MYLNNYHLLILKTKTILYAALALTLTACSSDDEQKAPVIQEIELFTQVSGSVTRAVNDADALQDAQLAAGTKISVKVKENATTPTVDYALTTYTADGLGALSLPEGVKQYYPANGNAVNIYAFHPAGTPSAFEVQTDQTSADNYKKSDLMWASLSNVTAASANHTLNFTHLLAKVIVKLEKGDFSETDLASATVTLGADDLITSGTFTAATGVFTPAASGTGTYTIATEAGTSEHAIIVVPQAISGKTINVTIGEVTKSYTILTPSFAAGKRYSYVLTLNHSGQISLIKSDITDWDCVEIVQNM